jgi:hypothetical protein
MAELSPPRGAVDGGGLLLVRCFRAFRSRAWFVFGVLLYDVLTRYRNAVPTAFRASLHRTGSL